LLASDINLVCIPLLKIDERLDDYLTVAKDQSRWVVLCNLHLLQQKFEADCQLKAALGHF
jgi:hypothetical protein